MGYYYMNENPTVAEYKLDDIEPGLKKNFKVTITESMSNDFAKLTGDNSPIHMNKHYARTTYFNQRICHGMLLGSFFSRLIGMHLPGKEGLCLSYSIRHLLPCFLNQEINVEGIVLTKSNATRIITLKATITDSSGKLLVDGLLKVLVRK
jgi:3-hydroxybutyryl-CoA dehydratase